MLKQKYSLSTPWNSQEIILDDFYVSPDLSFISGTTDNTQACPIDTVVWIRSPYFPEDLPQRVTNKETVKRNGYVLVPVTLQVNYAAAIVGADDEESVTVSYVEYNGNTYFANSGSDNTFSIEGVTYTPEDSFLTINTKVYIENDKLTVDGITFDVTINKQNELFLTDSIGNPYNYSWNAEHVTYESKWVSKLTIGENIKNSIDCRRVTSYGHKPYVVYDGEKKYLQYFYTESGTTIGAGVLIDTGNGEEIPYYIATYDNDPDKWFNLYDINDYTVDERGIPTILIGSDLYDISFEACDIANSGILGIETVKEGLPILIDDKIVIRLIDTNPQIRVKTDGEGKNYIYLNGRRYNVINNLCDSVVLGDMEYELTYSGDCEHIESGMIASCVMADGSTVYFQVISVSPEGKATGLKKVGQVGNGWLDLFTMTETISGTVQYSSGTTYSVHNYDGVRLGGYDAKVLHYNNEYGDGTESGTSIVSYDYIRANSSIEYKLRVTNTVGSNMVLCEPDISLTEYDDATYNELVTEVLSSVEYNRFVIEKRNNSFGTIDLYYDSWLLDASVSSGATSVYGLARVQENIRVIQKNTYVTIPFRLYKDISQKLEYEDLILTNYYDEEGEKAINKLVDMEKDMYSPVFYSKDEDERTVPLSPSKMVFNLHFRTRDLETWKIIEDEGVYSGPTENVLSANHDYCNWFITDYYPFYDYARDFSGTWEGTFNSNNFKTVIQRSDLLGFLYFTTNDASVSREKLRKSFLRLTFFDSINPEKQNMLGTSILYFDCNRYLDLINSEERIYHYEECVASRNPDRSGNVPVFYATQIEETDEFYINAIDAWKNNYANIKVNFADGYEGETPTLLIQINESETLTFNIQNASGTTSWVAGETVYMDLDYTNGTFSIADEPRVDSMYATLNKPTVLTQAFEVNPETINTVIRNAVPQMYVGDGNVVLDSRITVTDRYSSTNSSEGFDTYILKAFANKKKVQTIYMKAEFFHAGLGIKIPMIIPTVKNGDGYDAISDWSEVEFNEFKKGYDLNSVFERMYVPIQIKYDRELKKFVYSISDTHNFSSSIQNGDAWTFNLFELKVKPQ